MVLGVASEPKLSITRKSTSEHNGIPKSVEDILEKIGGFSWFQIWACTVLLFPEIPSAMISMSQLLTGSPLLNYDDYTCAEHPTLNITSDNFCRVLESCARLSYSGSQPHTTIVEEWNLYCDRAWIVDLITSVQMCGNTVAAILFPFLADKYGRRRIFFLLCLLMGLSGAAAGFAPNVEIFASLRFLTGLSLGGLYVVFLTYLMEFLTPSYRTICGCVTFWAVGEMLLAFVGYLLPAWRHLSVAVALPQLIILLAFPWFPESPRWLLCRGRTTEATAAFNLIARWNGRPSISVTEVESVQNEIMNQRSRVTGPGHSQGTCPKNKSWKILEVFKPNSLRRQLVLLIFIWFIMSIIYYALSFNVKNLGGDPYMNIFYLGLSELPGPFSGLLLNNRCGRKRTMIGFLTAGCLLLSLLVFCQLTPPELFAGVDVEEATKVLALVGRYCIAAAFAIMACATAESFPTSVRLTYSGVCGFFGNIGGILAPQLVFLATVWSAAPNVACCLLAIVLTLLCLGLKETSGENLRESPASMKKRLSSFRF